jgi:hypothetical protein
VRARWNGDLRGEDQAVITENSRADGFLWMGTGRVALRSALEAAQCLRPGGSSAVRLRLQRAMPFIESLDNQPQR